MTDRWDATPPRPEQAIADWHPAAWNDLAQRIAHVCPRTDSRANALSSLLGLVSPAERTKSWQWADITGAPTPYPVHHRLGRAAWSPDAVRAALLAYVPTILGHPEALGVVDETGLRKNGSHAAGVTRHATGTAGRVANRHVGVFLADARPLGPTLLDRELYPPTSWTDDPARCQRAGGPPDRTFATKPALARQMIARAAAAGITLAWITGDTVDGDDRPVRHWLDAPSQPSVLGMARTDHRWIAAQRVTLTDRAASRADTAWERHRCGDGSQGPRGYDWAATALHAPPQAGFQRRVALRRPVDDPQDREA
jgi:SRSO17 transposase